MGSFDKEEIEKAKSERELEDCKKCEEAVEVFKSTKYLYPGETVSIERIYFLNEPTYLHAGLRFKNAPF